MLASGYLLIILVKHLKTLYRRADVSDSRCPDLLSVRFPY